MDKSAPDQKQLLTEVIQKLMVVLGADLTLSKIHNVHGMTISEDGTVTDIQTEPEVLLREIIDEFVGLSSEIVKQITEILVSKQMHSQAAIALPSAPIQPGQNIAAPLTMPTPTPLPVTPVVSEPSSATTTAEPASSVVSTTEPTPTPMQQPTNDPFPNTQPTQPQVTQPLPQQSTPVQPVETTTQPTVNPPAPVTTPPPAQAQTQQNDPDMQHIINEALKQTK